MDWRQVLLLGFLAGGACSEAASTRSEVSADAAPEDIAATPEGFEVATPDAMAPDVPVVSDTAQPPPVSDGDAPFAPPAPSAPATRWVSPLGDDANPGTEEQPWRQIRHAAEQVGPGDVVEILDGTYLSPIILAGKNGTAEAPIVLRAGGDSAVVDGSGADGSAWDSRDAIYVYDSSYIVIHGLRESGAHRAGVRVSLSHHVTIQASVFADNGTWGIFTDFVDDLALLGNDCHGSKKEHGIYHSNSGDRVVIAGNLCHHNQGAGIQINADPISSAAEGGDGISSECLVERNWLHHNGAAGGAAINLASVRSSQIRNNLIHDNLATGIGMWDDGQGTEYGSRDNVIEHNTVVFESGEGRFCMTVWNGSVGNTIRNNVLVGGQRGAISFTADSLAGLQSDHNLFFSRDGWHLFEDDPVEEKQNFDQWKVLTGGDAASSKALPDFVDPGDGDYALADGSAGIDDGVTTPLAEAYDGIPRPQGAGHDIGAYER